MLFNEGGGAPYDHAGREMGVVSGSPAWLMSEAGLGIEVNDGQFVSVSSKGMDATRGAALVIFHQTGTPDTRAKFVVTADAEWQLFRDSSDTALNFQINSIDGAFTVPDLWDSREHVVVMAWDADLNTREIWIDGRSQGIVTDAFTAPTLGSTIHIGNRADGLRETGGTTHVFLLWNRVLTGPEVVELSRDPFGPFRPFQRPTVKAPAGGQAFTRSVAGAQPAATGTLTAGRLMVGAQPNATGALTRVEQAVRALAGDQPAATGTLTRIEKALRALAGAQPNATGTLTRVFGQPRDLTGAQPAATGVVTRIEKAVRALAGAQPAATGALTRLERALRALVGAQPAATGTLTRIEKAIRALAGSQPAATGALTGVAAKARQIFIRGEQITSIRLRGQQIVSLRVRGEQLDTKTIRGEDATTIGIRGSDRTTHSIKGES